MVETVCRLTMQETPEKLARSGPRKVFVVQAMRCPAGRQTGADAGSYHVAAFIDAHLPLRRVQ